MRSLCLGIGIPIILMLWVLKTTPDEMLPTTPSTSTNTEPSTSENHPSHQITVLYNDETCIMDLEAYLVGVVLAEMPASFHLEALKAQAVAARTYTVKQAFLNGRHGIGVICTDFACCQAYIDPESYISRGGQEKAVEQVSLAVKSTAGEVVVYNKELIAATYFSCAGGITEDAESVWGYDIPYLQPVISPGEENAPVFYDSKSFTAEELQLALGTRFQGPAQMWFSDVTYTAGGGVDTMVIGNTSYRGTTLRKLLNLRSTIFTVVVEKDIITFYTRGFGHRVGMSQYGANAMALANHSYRDILMHYYSGTEIVQYFDS